MRKYFCDECKEEQKRDNLFICKVTKTGQDGVVEPAECLTLELCKDCWLVLRKYTLEKKQ